ncbi:peptidase U32 family protein [Pelagicoccus sp. SDUM812003]|uniref:peptidase U32 family protein n=1 Tax=Pelagicoccus sp. SDUM812003 TaxID=3041267 RepID=UPI00280D8A44|nr:peptidase U32 family protein [Pelagicoccus sp. SDUM812003]MDQ8202496.1 U32 family peptidase [Pelagicoccus sp. SDUM812003]
MSSQSIANEPQTSSEPKAAQTPRPVELLAPAGCYASLQAAIDAGADSVYFGLAQLNMRARSRRSFHLKDLEEIMSRCHDAGVRGYLTLNTLLYDHDLKLCFALLEEAAKQKVDAVIASDMACILKARELGLEVHLSTQLSVSNYQSFKFYAQFCDRIVLARELNLSMIRKIHQQIQADDLRGPSGRPVEIEAFAHGALCIAVSGRCGMSLYTDNASANRGACTQNCRKEYKVIDQESGKELMVDNNFIMSPNDICTIDFLDQVLEAGVHTLKLEGRGRAPEYVATVVAAYRKGIDAIQASTFTPELVSELQQDLEKVYNRGLSSGYYLGREQGWSAAYGNKSTRQKIQAGRVTHYYAKIGVAEITATGPIKSGQEFLIIGDTSGVVSGTLPELRLDDSTTVDEVKSGQVFSIKVDAKVRQNDKFFLHLSHAGSARI